MKKLIASIMIVLLCVLCVLTACTKESGVTTAPDVLHTDLPTAPGYEVGASPTESGYKKNGIPTAAQYLENRLKERDNMLYVYKDFTDGLNHFTQKTWMGSNYKNIPAMVEYAEGHSGTSGIAAELDLNNHSWGGYMFINGVLEAGKISPVANFGELDAGIDLTGAEKLVFYAKGETGKESVEFFMGGLGFQNGHKTEAYADSTEKMTLGTVRLTKEWRKFEISLAGVDLSRIACGFGWVTNDRSNMGLTTVKFYMDDIHYVFSQGTSKPMFLQSYGSEAPGTQAAIINNFAYLYDNAAAAMALSYAGKHERARQIADAIVYALDNDRYFSDGRLRNAYMSGNPASFPGWLSTKGKEFAKLPGFYDAEADMWYEDYYAVSTSTGNLAWAVLALCEVYQNAPEHEEYLRAAQSIAGFILTQEDAKGGFAAGYEGWESNQTKATYKSTEHNIDLITVFSKLSIIAKAQRDVDLAKTYADASEHAKEFVLSMYDEEKGCFYTGTTADGVTTSKEVLPLDCNTWALLALGGDFTDGEKVLAFVEQNMAVGGGYDFNADRDGVWFEGTAQVALCYKLLGDTEKYDEILSYLKENSLPDDSLTAADRNGVTTGFMVSGTDIPWNYDKRGHVGATAWLAFALMGINPLER